MAKESAVPRLLDVSAAAELMDLTSWTLYELIREGRLPPGVVVRLGGRRIRINERALTSWLEQGGTEFDQREKGSLAADKETKSEEAT